MVYCIAFFEIIITVIAQALSSAEIKQDWEWLEQNIRPSLEPIENDEDITEFVCCKISSLVANDAPGPKDVDEGIIISTLMSVS